MAAAAHVKSDLGRVDRAATPCAPRGGTPECRRAERLRRGCLRNVVTGHEQLIQYLTELGSGTESNLLTMHASGALQ